MLGIGFWDWLAIGAYLIGITVLGTWTMVRVKDTADFFMGGRRNNRWLMMFFAFGAGTSGNDAVGVSSKTYTSGMSGIWYQWLWLFATPFYWLIAPVFRRMRAITTGDYFEQRYDGSVAALYAVVGVMQLTFNMGVLLRGGSVMIEAVSGGDVPWQWAAVGMTVLFLIYGMAGGLAAAILTDFVQGILTVILSFMLLPVALNAVGGMTGLREKIADPAVFTIVSPGEINTFHIVMMCLSALIGIVTQPHIMGVCAAGRNEMDGRFGFASGNLLKRFCTIAWMIVGLCGIALYPGLTGDQPDTIYGRVAADLLPTVMPGLVGIFLAALLASIMSSCDAFMVSSSGLFTQNFYRRFVMRGRSEGHYVVVGRVVSLLIVVASLFICFRIRSVPRGLELFFQIQALMGAAFWLGLFWRRTTVLGAWAGTLGGLVVLYLGAAGVVNTTSADLDNDGDPDRFVLDTRSTTLTWWEDLDGDATRWARRSFRAEWGPESRLRLFDVDNDGDFDILTAETLGPDAVWWENAGSGRALLGDGRKWVRREGETTAEMTSSQIQPWFVERLPKNMIWNGKFRLSWSIFFYLSTAFGLTLLVSLVTPRVSQAKLDRLYECLRTPVTGEEPHLAPFTLPPGVTPPPPRKLIDHPDLEIPMPTAVGMVGFAVVWAFVFGLIAFVYWLAGVGT